MLSLIISADVKFVDREISEHNFVLNEWANRVAPSLDLSGLHILEALS